MKPKPTSAAEPAPLRVVILTSERPSGAFGREGRALQRRLPGLQMATHAATGWRADATALARCIDDIGRGDIVVLAGLVHDADISAVLPALQARRPHCDAMVGCFSSEAVLQLTRMGRLDMTAAAAGPRSVLLRLGAGAADPRAAVYASSIRGPRDAALTAELTAELGGVLRLLRFVPGVSQDLYAFGLALQCLLAGAGKGIIDTVRLLVGRYAAGPRAALRALAAAATEAHAAPAANGSTAGALLQASQAFEDRLGGIKMRIAA